MGSTGLGVGLIGLGRMGRVYASHLASFGPDVRLAAIADTNAETVRAIGERFEVSRRYENPADLLADGGVDAVVIATPTMTHRDMVMAASESGKFIFCEKPVSISLSEALGMRECIARRGTFFQLGFMRRFDSGYAAARSRIQEGVIGDPVLFKSTSRDPFCPPISFLDPRSSGGLIMDMGVHDLDLARWMVGEIKSVTAVGGALANPELKTVGDIDTAVVSLLFEGGQLGIIDLSRHSVYGYDIFTEVLGTKGAIRIGYLRETPILVMTANQIAHDTVPHFPERFRDAYRLQLADFIGNVRRGRPPSVTIDDGIGALRVAIAATQALETGASVPVA